MNMAYSQGIDAALALVLGRVYIPVAAVGARCVLGKFYMWLEYAAIGILTLATVAFGYLKASGARVVRSETPNGPRRPSPGAQHPPQSTLAGCTPGLKPQIVFHGAHSAAAREKALKACSTRVPGCY